jgi:hypothetical protein
MPGAALAVLTVVVVFTVFTVDDWFCLPVYVERVKAQLQGGQFWSGAPVATPGPTATRI